MVHLQIIQKIKDSKVLKYGLLALASIVLFPLILKKFFKTSPANYDEKAQTITDDNRLINVARALSVALGTNKDLSWWEKMTEDDELISELLATLTQVEFNIVAEVYGNVFTKSRDLKGDIYRFLDDEYTEDASDLFSKAQATVKPEKSFKGDIVPQPFPNMHQPVDMPKLAVMPLSPKELFITKKIKPVGDISRKPIKIINRDKLRTKTTRTVDNFGMPVRQIKKTGKRSVGQKVVTPEFIKPKRPKSIRKPTRRL